MPWPCSCMCIDVACSHAACQRQTYNLLSWLEAKATNGQPLTTWMPSSPRYTGIASGSVMQATSTDAPRLQSRLTSAVSPSCHMNTDGALSAAWSMCQHTPLSNGITSAVPDSMLSCVKSAQQHAGGVVSCNLCCCLLNFACLC